MVLWEQADTMIPNRSTLTALREGARRGIPLLDLGADASLDSQEESADLGSFDPRQAVRNQISFMIKQVGGVTALLVDDHCDDLVKAVLSREEIRLEGVIVKDKLRNIASKKNCISHIPALVWLRASQQNALLLAAELADPQFNEYYIAFCGECPPHYVDQLALMDRFELVCSVRSYPGQVMALDTDLFTVGAFAIILELSLPDGRVELQLSPL